MQGRWADKSPTVQSRRFGTIKRTATRTRGISALPHWAIAEIWALSSRGSSNYGFSQTSVWWTLRIPLLACLSSAKKKKKNSFLGSLTRAPRGRDPISLSDYSCRGGRDDGRRRYSIYIGRATMDSPSNLNLAKQAADRRVIITITAIFLPHIGHARRRSQTLSSPRSPPPLLVRIGGDGSIVHITSSGLLQFPNAICPHPRPGRLQL
jgi:hypothetical protein